MPLPAAAIPAIIGGGKALLGAYQGIRAGKMKPKRPTRKVQQETMDIASTYGQMAQGGVPGSKAAIEDIQRSTQNVVQQSGRYTSSGANMLAMLGQAQAGETSAMRQAEIQRQKTQMGLTGQYMQAKANIAAHKQANWQYNQAQKFEEEAAAKSQLTGAAIENVTAGLQDIGGAAIKGMYGNQASTGVNPFGPKDPNLLKKKNRFNVMETYSSFPTT